jgi:hypothetical protein
MFLGSIIVKDNVNMAALILESILSSPSYLHKVFVQGQTLLVTPTRHACQPNWYVLKLIGLAELPNLPGFEFTLRDDDGYVNVL